MFFIRFCVCFCFSWLFISLCFSLFLFCFEFVTSYNDNLCRLFLFYCCFRHEHWLTIAIGWLYAVAAAAVGMIAEVFFFRFYATDSFTFSLNNFRLALESSFVGLARIHCLFDSSHCTWTQYKRKITINGKNRAANVELSSNSLNMSIKMKPKCPNKRTEGKTIKILLFPFSVWLFRWISVRMSCIDMPCPQHVLFTSSLLFWRQIKNMPILTSILFHLQCCYEKSKIPEFIANFVIHECKTSSG